MELLKYNCVYHIFNFFHWVLPIIHYQKYMTIQESEQITVLKIWYRKCKWSDQVFLCEKCKLDPQILLSMSLGKSVCAVAKEMYSDDHFWSNINSVKLLMRCRVPVLL